VLALFRAQASAFAGLRTTYNNAVAAANAQCGKSYAATATGAAAASADIASGAPHAAHWAPTLGALAFALMTFFYLSY
jgi:hypothetical protein